MPPTSVYLVLPASMAWIAASLMLAGVSKSGSPAPRPMTLRPAAFSARALSVTAMVADSFTRSSAADRNGIVISLIGVKKQVSPHRSTILLMGSRHPKARSAASQEAWPKCGQTLGNVKTAGLGWRNIHKIPRQNDSFLARAAIRPMADAGAGAGLQPDPARPLRAGAGRLDRRLGRFDRPQRQAARHRLFQCLRRARPDAARPAGAGL